MPVIRIRPFGPLPRKLRRERGRWDEAAYNLDGSPAGETTAGGFTKRPYLMVHPEREIADVYTQGRYLFASCPACRYDVMLNSSRPSARPQEIVHAHNAERHPRRWLRSQHFQADLPAAVRDRSQA